MSDAEPGADRRPQAGSPLGVATGSPLQVECLHLTATARSSVTKRSKKILTNTNRGAKDMQKITPFFWYDNQAEEAANFYVSIFKNSKVLNVVRYGEAGPGPKGSVMIVEFELEGQKFVGLNGGPLFNFTEAVSFAINCQAQEEVDYFWEKLTADGGQESKCGC